MTQDFNRERHTGRNLTSTLAMGVFLTALTVGLDKIAGHMDQRQRRKQAQTVDHIHDGGKAIYILPGCRADGAYLGGMLEPHIEHLGTTHHEAYPEEGFSLDTVKQSLLEARAKDGEKPAIFYAMSMGGMVLTKLLIDDEFRGQFGKIDKVIFDSSPSKAGDLDRGTRLLMLAASLLPSHSWTVSQLYKQFMLKKARKAVEHSSLVTDEQAQGHAISTANTPLGAVESQTAFIDAFNVKEGDGSKAADEINEIYYISAGRDHVVTNIEGAYKNYNRIFGGKVLRIIDLERPNPSHADGPEFPRKIVELMETKLPDSNEPTTAPNAQPEFIPVLRPSLAA